MANQQSDTMGTNGHKRAQKSARFLQYSPDIMYKFWALASGNVRKAIRLAEDAGEDRVPIKPHTWARYAENYKFPERLKEEEKQYWEQFHAERKAQLRPTIGKWNQMFEIATDLLHKRVLQDAWFLTSDDADIDPKSVREAGVRLTRLFGSPNTMENLLRAYYRNHDLPEHMSQQTVNNDGKAVTYEELEKKDNWPKSIEEMRRKKKGLTGNSPENT